jgi:hypothetical protein
MKLSEIKILKEEPIPIRSAEELWQENGSDGTQYITTTVYFARPVQGKRDAYDVFYDQQGKRKKYGTMNEEDLNAAFAPLRPNQKPDAEGFLSYRSADVYDAFKYSGDPVRVTLGEEPPEEAAAADTVKLNRGDYLLRQDDGKNFTYSIEKDAYFSNGYTKKT